MNGPPEIPTWFIGLCFLAVMILGYRKSKGGNNE